MKILKHSLRTYFNPEADCQEADTMVIEMEITLRADHCNPEVEENIRDLFNVLRDQVEKL